MSTTTTWPATGLMAGLLTLITEVALLISLFAVGLRLRVELSSPIWRLPLRLGVIGMLVTIALLTAATGAHADEKDYIAYSQPTIAFVHASVVDGTGAKVVGKVEAERLYTFDWR